MEPSAATVHGGLLLCTSPRLDWATLMRRTHATDVLECSQCHGRLRVLAVITEPDVARAALIGGSPLLFLPSKVLKRNVKSFEVFNALRNLLFRML